MKLIIAEKPSVAKSISEVVGAVNCTNGFNEGNGFIVSWCVGHLVELASPESYNQSFKSWSINNLPIIPPDWNWKFTVKSNTAKQYKILQTLLNREDVDEVICATDAGREGECIFRYLYNLAQCRKPVKRLWISSVEESEIRSGLNTMKNDSEYDNLFRAGYARAKADWLVGMNCTRLFSCMYNAMLTIGRVQTPTLNLIVKRQNDINNFISQKYYTVVLDCHNFKAESERIDDFSLAKSILQKTDGTSAFIKSIEKETKKVNPPKLFNLADLQKTANRLLGYTAQQTLNIAQELYENKLITYPRTDSNYINDCLAEKAMELCRLSIDFMNAEPYTPDTEILVNNKKVTDHHALLPTAELKNKEKISALLPSHLKLLQLICSQLICASASPYVYEQTLIMLISGNTEFTAKGNKVIDNGFKLYQNHFNSIIADRKTETKETILPDNLFEGLIIENVVAEISDHKTSPPKLYTDASLISAMERAGNDDYDDETEKKGIGTQATQAGIIEKIIKCEYVKRDKKNLIPTEKGIALINAIPEDIKSPKLTAQWENKLQLIEKGKYSAETFMKEIENFTSKLVEVYSSKEKTDVTEFKNNITIAKCPMCSKNVIETAKAYSCEGGKGCGFIVWKTISGKSISASTAKILIEKGKTAVLKGFTSKAGKKFDAKLVLTDGKVKFSFK